MPGALKVTSVFLVCLGPQVCLESKERGEWVEKLGLKASREDKEPKETLETKEN